MENLNNMPNQTNKWAEAFDKEFNWFFYDAERANYDSTKEEIKSFISQAIKEERERVIEEVIECVPAKKDTKIENFVFEYNNKQCVNDIDMGAVYGFNECLQETLQELNKLKTNE